MQDEEKDFEQEAKQKLKRIDNLKPSGKAQHVPKQIRTLSLGIDDNVEQLSPETEQKLEKLKRIEPRRGSTGAAISKPQRGIVKASLGIDSAPTLGDDGSNEQLDRAERVLGQSNRTGSFGKRTHHGHGILQEVLGVEEVPKQDTEMESRLDETWRKTLKMSPVSPTEKHAESRVGILRSAMGITNQEPTEDDSTKERLNRVDRVTGGFQLVATGVEKHQHHKVMTAALGTERTKPNTQNNRADRVLAASTSKPAKHTPRAIVKKGFSEKPQDKKAITDIADLEIDTTKQSQQRQIRPVAGNVLGPVK
ncbi:hypothetical protein EDD86DRAFT_205601 [Gorgonomyces haynaldii]|nr:hypothetical protein EDD86DRAFT_205601 [Gorgonomyces haynaldii]